MDQKNNEVEKIAYCNRIATATNLWNNTKDLEHGRIIGKDGTVFAKTADGKLVQVIDPKNKELCRAARFVSAKVNEQGLVPNVETKEVETDYAPVTEYVTEL